MALLLEGFLCGVFNVEGSARDPSGPLPAQNRKAGNPVANSLAPCLFGRRHVQVQALQSFEVANRVRHLSRTSHSANVGRWFSVVCSFLESSGGRRNQLGRQHSTPCHELIGTPWQRRSQSSRAISCGGGARRRYGGARPRNVSSSHGAATSWGQGTSTKAMARRIKRERSAAPTADVKKETTGPPLAKKPKGKSDGKGRKNSGALYTVDQAGGQFCFSWNSGGGTCGILVVGRVASFHQEAHVGLAEFTNAPRAGQTSTRRGSAYRLDCIKKWKKL